MYYIFNVLQMYQYIYVQIQNVGSDVIETVKRDKLRNIFPLVNFFLNYYITLFYYLLVLVSL